LKNPELGENKEMIHLVVTTVLTEAEVITEEEKEAISK